MDDLISRAAAIEGIDAMLRYYDEKTSPLHRRILTDIREGLNEIPAVDAAQVVHAYWKGWAATHWNKRYQDNGDPEYVEHTYYSCSECRRRTVIREKYCPNCGAKMDGRDGE